VKFATDPSTVWISVKYTPENAEDIENAKYIGTGAV
jgi:hypothetical protein